MSLPLIGLTTNNLHNQYGYPIAALMHMYINVVTDAGGAPVLIPSGLTDMAAQTITDRLDGIIFTGGGDIAIQYFNGEPHDMINTVDKQRDRLELSLVRTVADIGKPFLGICRGIQIINVALGGTLYTHVIDQLPNAIKHDYDSRKQREFLAHEVKVNTSSQLAEISGELVLKVNSLHHQGVRDLAPVLKPVAHAADGLVEGVEMTGHPFGIGVQWHPEWLTKHIHAQRLFRAFMKACGQ